MKNKLKQSNRKHVGFILSYLIIPLVVVGTAVGLRAVADSADFTSKIGRIAGIIELESTTKIKDAVNSQPELGALILAPEETATNTAVSEPEPQNLPEDEDENELVPTPTTQPDHQPEAVPPPVETPEPTPVQPAYCSVHLTYNIGQIDPIFFEKGFSRAGLTNIVKKAEQKWEKAVNIDLFNRTDDARNTINFVKSNGFLPEPGHFGIIEISTNERSAVNGFDFNIYDSLFIFAENPNITYFGDPVEKDDLYESILSRAVLHMMGHAFGLGHLDDSVSEPISIMTEGQWIPTSYIPSLADSDKELARNFCESK